MIDREYFRQVKTGLAHPPDVEDYYNKICEYVTRENLEFKELSELIDQKDVIEEVYGFKQEKPKEEDPKNLKLTPEKVIEKIDDLIDRDLTEDQLLPVLNYLAPDLGWQPHRLLELYKVRQQILEEKNLKDEFEIELSQILRLVKVDISLEDFLPDSIVSPLNNYCKNAQIRESITLLHLLTAVSVCHTVGTNVLVDESKNWYEPPNLFSMMVSPSGQGKSPIMKTLITQPFWEIQSQWAKSHERDCIDYERELMTIKAMSKEDRASAYEDLSQPLDRPRIIFSTDPTVIGFNCQFNAYPQQGILGLFDEARKLLGFDRTSSQHSDRSDLLSYFNSGATVELRVDGVRSNTGETLLGLFGSIQPDVLMDWMNTDDFDGQWARFLLVTQPLQRKLPSRESGKVDIKDLILRIYRELLSLPKINYYLEYQAGKLFDEYFYGEVEDCRLATTNSGLAALYGKCGSKVARLALNLHVLENPTSMAITIDTVEKAIMLDRFFLNQTKILYAQSQALAGELAPKLAQIVQLSRQVGQVNARNLWRSCRAFRNDDPTQIREWFKQLESLGKGQCQGSGNRLTFKSF
jgi:hypothetical protein